MHRIIPIKKQSDPRGWLAEILKKSQLKNQAFGQFFLTTAKPGITKGNHYHTRKNEYFIVVRGEAVLVLHDIDKKTTKKVNKQQIQLSQDRLRAVEILPFTHHQIKNIGPDEMWLLVYIDEEFNPQDPDTHYLNTP